MQPSNLRRQIEWMVADEETRIMHQIGIWQTVDTVIVVMLDDVVAGDAATGNDAKADVGLFQCPHDFRS